MSDSTKKKVLLIHRDPELQYDLEMRGYDVVRMEITSGSGASHLLQTHQPDVVVMGRYVPSGYIPDFEAAAVPVIIITSQPATELAHHENFVSWQQSHALKGVITLAPDNIDSLAEKIEEVLGNPNPSMHAHQFQSRGTATGVDRADT